MKYLRKCLLAVMLAMTAQASERLSLTIYNAGYTTVRESKHVTVPKGQSTVEHVVISDYILDEPIRCTIDGTRVLDQRFRYDEFSLDYLLDQHYEKRIGLELKEYPINEDSKLEYVEGVLLSRLNASGQQPGGLVLLRQDDGTIRTIEERVVVNYKFLSEPQDFYGEPTILWSVQAADSSRRQMDITYEVTGIDWGAYYTLDLNNDDSTAVFSGWVSIRNGGDKTLKDAELKLIYSRKSSRKRSKLRAGRAELAMQAAGGNVSRIIAKQSGFKVDADGGIHFRGGRDHEAMVQVDGTAFRDPIASSTQAGRLVNFSALNVEEIETLRGGAASHGGYQSALITAEALFGSHLYKMPHRVTLQKNSITEVALFPAKEISLETEFEYLPWAQARSVGVYVKLRNDEASGLGKPLPAGEFRIYSTTNAGMPEYVASEHMQHFAAEDSLRVRVGEAPMIRVTRERIEYEQHSDRKFDEAWETTFENLSVDDFSFTMFDRFRFEYRFLDSTHEFEPIGERLVKLPLTIPAGEKVSVLYKARMKR